MRSNYQQMNPMQNMMQAFQQFSQNPAEYFQRMGIQIPQGMNSPTQIWNWMQQSGNISPQQMSQIQQAQRSAANSPVFNQYFSGYKR